MSVTSARPSVVTSTQSGVMPPCTTPWSCIARSAASTSRPTAATDRAVIGSPPSTSDTDRASGHSVTRCSRSDPSRPRSATRSWTGTTTRVPEPARRPHLGQQPVAQRVRPVRRALRRVREPDLGDHDLPPGDPVLGPERGTEPAPLQLAQQQVAAADDPALHHCGVPLVPLLRLPTAGTRCRCFVPRPPGLGAAVSSLDRRDSVPLLRPSTAGTQSGAYRTVTGAWSDQRSACDAARSTAASLARAARPGVASWWSIRQPTSLSNARPR